MPLDKSGSKASVGANIKTERAAGKPLQQAIAIALSTQRRAKGQPDKPPPPAQESPAAERAEPTQESPAAERAEQPAPPAAPRPTHRMPLRFRPPPMRFPGRR